MQFLADELTEFTKAVWGSVLDPGITPVAEVPASELSDPSLTAWVQIAGPWNGALLVRCGEDTVRMAASVMLEMEPSEASEEDLADVLGELANMIGGNVKALLPEPSLLGLPNVVGGKEYLVRLPGSHEVTRLGFEWRGGPVVVTLMQSDGTEAPS